MTNQSHDELNAAPPIIDTLSKVDFLSLDDPESVVREELLRKVGDVAAGSVAVVAVRGEEGEEGFYGMVSPLDQFGTKIVNPLNFNLNNLQSAIEDDEASVETIPHEQLLKILQEDTETVNEPNHETPNSLDKIKQGLETISREITLLLETESKTSNQYHLLRDSFIRGVGNYGGMNAQFINEMAELAMQISQSMQEANWKFTESTNSVRIELVKSIEDLVVEAKKSADTSDESEEHQLQARRVSDAIRDLDPQVRVVIESGDACRQICDHILYNLNQLVSERYGHETYIAHISALLNSVVDPSNSQRGALLRAQQTVDDVQSMLSQV